MDAARRKVLDDLTHAEVIREIRRRGRTGKPGFAPPEPATVDALTGVDTADLFEALREKQSVIYGEDNRTDVFELKGSVLENDAAAVALVLPRTHLTLEDGGVRIRTEHFGARWNLCSWEPFRTQPCVTKGGTAFLVAPDLVATAAHNLTEVGPLETIAFVFGYRMLNEFQARTLIPAAEVINGTEVVAIDKEADWALIRLASPAPATARNVRVRRYGTGRLGERVYGIGHGLGLPMKYTGDATVKTADTNTTFVGTDLDFFKGNSGSPVFDLESRTVIAMDIRGPGPEIHDIGKCSVTVRCTDDQCLWIDAVNTSEFAGLVPGYTYAIAAHSGLPLAVRDGVFADGHPVVQETFTGGDSQCLRIETLPDRWARILVNHSGKVLQIEGDSTDEGARVVQGTWTGRDTQMWTIDKVDGARYRIIPRKRPALCLDVRGGARDSGAEVIQWRVVDGAANQLWYLAAPVVNVHSGMVMSIRGGSRKERTPLDQDPYVGGDNQLFQILRVSGNTYRIMAQNGTSLALTSEFNGLGGGQIQLIGWQELRQQLWYIHSAGAGTCRIQSVFTGLFLQPPDTYARTEGAPIIDAPQTTTDLQRWRLQIT